MTHRANWRIYDLTGGDMTHDVYAADEADAIIQGREWIEAGDWEASEIAYTLEAAVAPILYADDGTVDEEATAEAWHYDAVDCSGVGPVAGPPETECGSEDDDHAWAAPHEIVGGCSENPGVWGSGHGEVSVKHVCSRCGLIRQVDYGATNPLNGTRATMTTYDATDRVTGD